MFCLVFRFCIELEINVYGSIKNELFYYILQIYNTKLNSFQNLILGFIVKIRKFQPCYSYKIYFKKGDSAAPISLQLISVRIQINQMKDNVIQGALFLIS